MSRSWVMPAAVGTFALGLLAIIAVFALYASGHDELPLWLNLATLLAPLGFVAGVVVTVVRARQP